MRRLRHDRRILLSAALAALPAVAVALILLWLGDFAPRTRWTLTAVIVLSWIAFASSLWERLVRPLQTVSNLLAAMREGDFSIRARGARAGDPLGEVLFEVNALTETLQHQRLKALEATALLSRVMAEIDVAVFAFDQAGKLKLTNRAGERLLGQPEQRLIGADAAALGLDACLREDAPAILDTADPRARARAQQLARAHPVARREPAGSARPARAAAGLARRHAKGSGGDRLAIGIALAVHERLREARPAPAAPLPEGGRRASSLPGRRAGDATRGAAPGRGSPVGPRRPGPARAGRHQSPPQRRGRRPGERGRRRSGMEARYIPGAAPRGLDPGRRARPLEHRKPLRSLLHDKTRRLGHRAGSLATDRRGPRRLAHS